MWAHFEHLTQVLEQHLAAGEGYTLWLAGEITDFVRFNHGKVRQPGQVRQAYLTLQLLRGQRHASQTLSLSGTAEDFLLLNDAHALLREVLNEMPEDPYLRLNTEVTSSERRQPDTLPSPNQMVADIVQAAEGSDLVGLLATGPMFYGFANHLGQRNWQETASWNFNWSLYAQGDKAVKRGSAGFDWNPDSLHSELEAARQQLELLAQPPRILEPGQYRAYLTPAAVAEILTTLNWGGFSEKERRARRCGLQKLHDGEAQLSPLITLYEDSAGGLAPAFQREGFRKPERITLIEAGHSRNTLISARSAAEYGLATNGADEGEGGESLTLQGGDLPMADVLSALGTGLYLSNLHYLNYSDRSAGRLTGMTRFACFWVEKGEIVAPLNVMRFDDSIYRLFGSELEALTRETEFQADPGTYEARSCASVRVPGALVRGFNLVL